MATNTLHITLRAAAVLAAAALVAAAAFFSEGVAAARVPETLTVDTARTAAAAGRCPLRLPRRLPYRERVVPILMYHRISVASPSAPEITRRLTVHPTTFARQMKWLKRHGYRTLTQRQLFEGLMCGRRLGRKPIVITFDDGYRDNYLNASPVLARLGMHATAYVITRRISSKDRSFLTWRQLRALERRGVEIGSHTVSHRALTGLSDSQAFAELVKARRTLERRLGHRVPWLAYPFGSYDARIERLARRAGYLLAVTTQWGTRQSARRPFALPRLRILDSTGVRGLAAMLG
jgi:peptidoglycan/xylan/chitin deacetylase (PgdA/CDA1 family)